ncbi:hypothetical protein GCM10009433_00350 [Psychroflexus lacisalsi]|uniref:O-antigen ligase-related domain-containing protein n=2 Tax=Psychroflexus lacisalsi TaxID=503928 RepID=A0ABP3V7K7_9FLAO
MYSVVISLIFGVNGNFLEILFQTLISIKFFIILLAFIELFKYNYKTLNKFFFIVIGFTVFGLLLHLSFGLKFNQWIGISAFARPDTRYVGFFTHPNHLAYMMIIYAGYILNNKYKINKNLNFKDLLKILICFIIIILADSRTAMLSIGLLITAFYSKYFIKNYKVLLSFLFLGFLASIYAYFFTGLLDSIAQNINQSMDLTSSYIRGNMIYLSGLISIDYFPIGTGAATFGSVISDDIVYEIYGQADRYYFKNEQGIYDSNVASIIGEYGVMGIIFFFFMFYYLLSFLKKISTTKTFVFPIILVFLFYSITNPMLTNNLYTIITSILLVLFITKSSDTQNKIKWKF